MIQLTNDSSPCQQHSLLLLRTDFPSRSFPVHHRYQRPIETRACGLPPNPLFISDSSDCGSGRPALLAPVCPPGFTSITKVSVRSTFLSFSCTQKHFISSCQATMSDCQPTSKGLPSSSSYLVTSLRPTLASLSPLSAFPLQLHYAVSHSTVFSILSVVRVDVLFIIHVYNATLPLPFFTSLVPDLISPASRRLLHH